MLRENTIILIHKGQNLLVHLLGSGLLYINSGTTSLEGIYIITTISDIVPDNTITGPAFSATLEKTVDFFYINLSLIIITVGFLFKVSAAPFHF